MPVVRDWKLNVGIDQVLRGQGADPAVVKERNPRLAALAARALNEGLPLIDPLIAYRELTVESLNHQRLQFSEGGSLSGKSVARLLGPAKRVVVVLATIGGLLENYSAGALKADPPYGLALNGLGSAAIDALAVAACAYFGEQAAKDKMATTIPLSPGMDGWDMQLGQRQIFALIDPGEAGITLTESGMMWPQKSLTMVIGAGPEVENEGRVCDYCSMRYNCRYQEHYA